MPYVPQKDRDAIDADLEAVVRIGRALVKPDKRAGLANYAITRIVLGLLLPEDERWNYSSLADTIKTFECAKQEVYRRMVAPYEDKAIEKNGDLKELTAT